MRIRASTQAGVTAFRDLVKLLSELPGHIPPGINVAPFGPFSAVQLRLPRDRKLLRVIMHAHQRRWSLKRVVQPHVQVAIEEQLLPQQRRQRR